MDGALLMATKLVVSVPLGSDATVTVNTTVDYFSLQLGQWWVEVREGDLVVRAVAQSPTSPTSTGEVLRVPAEQTP
jgi:hypothetical protein